MRALITGGAKRLGREMSLYLAKRGYDVAVHYNSSDDDARVVVDEIHAMGRRATQLQANILDESQVETLVSPHSLLKFMFPPASLPSIFGLCWHQRWF